MPNPKHYQLCSDCYEQNFEKNCQSCGGTKTQEIYAQESDICEEDKHG